MAINNKDNNIRILEKNQKILDRKIKKAVERLQNTTELMFEASDNFNKDC